jgi:uncharacterized RDD family membrane protein YckC
MVDDQQTPPSGPTPAPDAGSSPPQPGWSDAPAGWPAPSAQPAPGAWPGPPQQPAPGAWPAAPAGYPPQQGYPGAYTPPGYPPQPGYPPPGYGGPMGYPPPGYGGPMGYPPVGYGAIPQYAGFWIRLVAFVLDVVIWAVAVLVALISVVILVGFVLVPLVFFGYWPYFWWKGGATPGMKVLGLRVVRAIDGGPIGGGMACIRALLFYVELFFSPIGLLGFVWAAFEPRKRALHDMAAGTVVIQAN